MQRTQDKEMLHIDWAAWRVSERRVIVTVSKC